MYFAEISETDCLNDYIFFLKEIINNHNSNYINLFKDVISEAKVLSETQNYYKVSSERYLIIRLIASNSSLINSLNPQSLSNNDYMKIFNFLQKQTSEA